MCSGLKNRISSDQSCTKARLAVLFSRTVKEDTAVEMLKDMSSYKEMLHLLNVEELTNRSRSRAGRSTLLN